MSKCKICDDYGWYTDGGNAEVQICNCGGNKGRNNGCLSVIIGIISVYISIFLFS